MAMIHDPAHRISRLLGKGVEEGVYPGAVLLVTKGGQRVLLEAVGNLSVIPPKAPMRKDTLFDLASLTKPLVTGLAIMALVDEGRLSLEEVLPELIKARVPADKRGLTLRSLLCHSAGLADWKPFYETLVNYELKERKAVLRDLILREPLVYSPGKGCLYSDLGFMVLEWVIEEASGMQMHQFAGQRFFRPLELERAFLWTEHNAKRFKKEEFAATEDCPWRKKVLQGEVHDANAYALGGYSGHAGFFGTAEAVLIIVDLLREHYLGTRSDYFRPETVRQFLARQEGVEGCKRALAWDMPSAEIHGDVGMDGPRKRRHRRFSHESRPPDPNK
ncbi:MAG: serine hydrolase [Deltaproteobacteria bacterium]|nr:serine hydrolase [Deltaproteobacteria bacterium]